MVLLLQQQQELILAAAQGVRALAECGEEEGQRE